MPTRTITERNPANDASPWRSVLDVGLLLLLAIVVPLIVLRQGLRPADPLAGVAVLYPPWTDARTAVVNATAAGASLVRFGAFEFIIIVKPDTPTYVDRVLSEGALLALDPAVLALCAPGLLDPESLTP